MALLPTASIKRPDAENPMRGYRLNNRLTVGLIVTLLGLLFLIAALFYRSGEQNINLINANARADNALAQAKALHIQRDSLIEQAAMASPGSPAQKTAIARLVQTASDNAKGPKGDKGETGPAPAGFSFTVHGVTYNCLPDRSMPGRYACTPVTKP